MATDSDLVLLDRANQLLSKATSLDELKEVRDAAEAARTFAKAARLGLELQNRAAELKLRAERKAGAFLTELHLRGGDRRSKPHRVTLKLDDLGITKRQSELWQLAASVPDKQFESYVRGKFQLNQELTASGLLRIAKALRRQSLPRVRRDAALTGTRAAAQGARAELLALIGELKNQCRHLATLLEPLAAGGEVTYKPVERRFIGRLARDVEQGVEEIEKHLWNCG